MRFRRALNRVLAAIRARFSLRDDHGDDARIDADLRAGVPLRGTNLWVLILAIFIASIGLNLNSTAVIIGAMLISPLMGPVMAVGYGVGILDFALMRESLKNLGVAVAIALPTSTAYFLLSPLRGATPELLARTSPNIWDVLIAVFGGLAGIIGVTRRQPSNVIPGVAIATALMPPLSTAGYGLATGGWQIAFDAMYLFTINCVFIAATSALVIRAFRVRRAEFLHARDERRVRVAMGLIVLVTLIPSLYLAYRLVGEEVFRTRAAQFVRAEFGAPGTHVSDVVIDARRRRIEVTLLGTIVPSSALAAISGRLSQAGLASAQLQVYQATEQALDMDALEEKVATDLYNRGQQAVTATAAASPQPGQGRDAQKATEDLYGDIAAELRTLYPAIERVLVSETAGLAAGGDAGGTSTVVVVATAKRPLSSSDREKIEKWLRMRTRTDRVRLVVELR